MDGYLVDTKDGLYNCGKPVYWRGKRDLGCSDERHMLRIGTSCEVFDKGVVCYAELCKIDRH
jgi:hypothetical protein